MEGSTHLAGREQLQGIKEQSRLQQAETRDEISKQGYLVSAVITVSMQELVIFEPVDKEEQQCKALCLRAMGRIGLFKLSER